MTDFVIRELFFFKVISHVTMSNEEPYRKNTGSFDFLFSNIFSDNQLSVNWWNARTWMYIVQLISINSGSHSFSVPTFYKLHLYDSLVRANISSMCHVSGLSHHGISCTLQCKFTLRITHGAPLTTRSVFLAMLYLTVVTPVSLSLWNDTWKDNMNTNKEFQDFKSKEWKFRSGGYLITTEDLTSKA